MHPGAFLALECDFEIDGVGFEGIILRLADHADIFVGPSACLHLIVTLAAGEDGVSVIGVDITAVDMAQNHSGIFYRFTVFGRHAAFDLVAACGRAVHAYGSAVVGILGIVACSKAQQ